METITIELEGQNYTLDVAKIASVIDGLGSVKSSAERNIKRGKYLSMIDRIALERFDIGIDEKPTTEQRITVIQEMI